MTAQGEPVSQMERAVQLVKRVELVYPARLLDQPIVYRVITELGVQLNVLEAEVNKHGGWLIVELSGTSAAVIRAMEWLVDRGIKVSIITKE